MNILRNFLGIVFLAMSLGFANTGFAGLLSEGLEIYLPFDGNAEDMAGTPSQVTETNIRYEAGKFGKAARFDEIKGAYVSISAVDVNTNDFTVSFWFKTSDIDGYMVDARQGGQETGFYLISFPNPNSGIWFGVQNGSLGGQTYSLSGLDDSWHMATGVRRDNSIMLFIDGMLVDEYTGDSVLDIDSPPITMGKRYIPDSRLDHYYDGLIDDFRYYSRALDEDEVAALYQYNPVPLPGGVWLLASGLIGLAGVKRMRLAKKC
ncbi:MAG: hypothetical protein GXO58_06115 [Thermodesulfobacteria bacterium]|nr:hypothetical protein [Thermodesulfobacteriota bacterium]